jgi:hypothetical protein
MGKPMDDLCCLAARGASLVVDQHQYPEPEFMALGTVVQAYQGTRLFLYTHARAVAVTG